jgi:hypothetical protein
LSKGNVCTETSDRPLAARTTCAETVLRQAFGMEKLKPVP